MSHGIIVCNTTFLAVGDAKCGPWLWEQTASTVSQSIAYRLSPIAAAYRRSYRLGPRTRTLGL